VAEPDVAVLTITTVAGKHYFSIKVDELARLAKQLQIDARLLISESSAALAN
jgi:hypothetical protein